MFFPKAIFGVLLFIFAVSALVPLLGIGVLVPELGDAIFDALEKLFDRMEVMLLGAGSPVDKQTRNKVNFSWKDPSSFKRLLTMILYHILKVFYLIIWYVLRLIAFVCIQVPNEIGIWLARFATLRSILTTRPLDEEEVTRATAPGLARDELFDHPQDDSNQS